MKLTKGKIVAILLKLQKAKSATIVETLAEPVEGAIILYGRAKYVVPAANVKALLESVDEDTLGEILDIL